MSSMKKSVIHQPYFGYIKEARRDKWAVIDIQVPAKLWRLKQTQTGSSEDLALLNDLLLYIWDNFLVLSDTDNIFFVSSGLPSYAVCHLLDKRITSTKVRGVVVLSPTLYLPVASPDRSEWYGINSLVIIPTKRPIGTPIATNASFGSCLSSGSDDPAEINSVISDCQDRVFSFIRSRSDQNWPGLSTA